MASLSTNYFGQKIAKVYVWSLIRAASCPPVYHTRWKFHTVAIAKLQAGKMNTNFYNLQCKVLGFFFYSENKTKDNDDSTSSETPASALSGVSVSSKGSALSQSSTQDSSSLQIPIPPYSSAIISSGRKKTSKLNFNFHCKNALNKISDN